MPNATPRLVRVAFLIVDLEIGGAQRALERLVTHLDRSRFEPIVVSLRALGPVARSIERSGIRVIGLGMRGAGDASALCRLYRVLRRFRPDVLHTFLFHANLAGRVVGRLARVPRIVSAIHTLEGGPLHFPLERLTWRLADRVLFVSQAVAQGAARRAGIVGAVVPNGVAEGVGGKPGLKAELGGRVVAAAGRLTPGKGFEAFLEVARLLAPRFPDVHFAIVGGGALEASLREAAPERVHFTGWLDDVAAALAGCDVFVHASRLGEGLPNAVLEAMAAGVPVVATDTGGTGEAVADGETGLLVRGYDASSLAQAVESLLASPERARAMGESGRRRAAERFGLEAMVRHLQQVYLEFSEPPWAGRE